MENQKSTKRKMIGLAVLLSLLFSCVDNDIDNSNSDDITTNTRTVISVNTTNSYSWASALNNGPTTHY